MGSLGSDVDLVKADLYRYSRDTGSRAFLRSYLRDPGFRFTYHLRGVAKYARTKRTTGVVPYFFHRMLHHRFKYRFGFDISPMAEIGGGFYLGHFGGVVISPFAKLGKNINIAHGVTIGAISRGPKVGAPTLEDRVWVGTGAIIVGNITIGHDALIGPGAYVNSDIPPMSVVLGNPGTIVAQSGSIGYVNNVLNEEEVLKTELTTVHVA
jgi:serine O-acetyltransferase